MKKLMMIFAVSGVLFATGCKKDHTCTCTIDGVDYPTSMPDTDKNDAKEACDALEDAAQSADPEATCDLSS